MTRNELWQRYAQGLCVVEPLGIALDVSRMRYDEALLARPSQAIENAWDAMEALEAGAVANPDEERRVGHYWLRAPDLAPEPALADAIRQTRQAITTFVDAVHEGDIRTVEGELFRHFLLVGIGGSALGPQLIDDALRTPDDPMRAWFCDNTDPDGIDRTLATLGDDLAQTLVIVVSKSGGTKETRNGMLEVAHTFERLGLDFAKQACAITSPGSALDKIASDGGWQARFEMWDWVGGRTSVTSAVGLLPAALQGVDVDALLAGAAEMDTATRNRHLPGNPAALLALMWHDAAGRGLRDMVVLPYKDRLALFSRYLQQLIMESIGKGHDLDGKLVCEGLTVYGNKGSTDQHAYVQQLREGLHNFHVTFIDVLRDRDGTSLEVEPGVTSGDYLQGFLLGTRDALFENGRESMGITLDRLDARSVGGLIALYERAVGYYASLVHVNAYHQPGVEAGKKAAGEVIALQQSLLAAMAAHPSQALDAEAWADRAGAGDQVEWSYRILDHLAANPERGVSREPGTSPRDTKFQFTPRAET